MSRLTRSLSVKDKVVVIVAVTMVLLCMPGCGSSSIDGLEPMQVSWTANVGVLSNIVVNGTFVLANGTTTTGRNELFCFEAESGEKRWSFLGVSQFTEQTGFYEDYACVIDEKDELVLLEIESGRVARAVNLNSGETDANDESPYSEEPSTITGFAISKSTCVFGTQGGTIGAYDLSGNTRTWTSSIPSEYLLNLFSPIVVGERVVVLSDTPCAFSLADGTPIWTSGIKVPKGAVPTGDSVAVWNENTLSRVRLADGETVYSKRVSGDLQQSFATHNEDIYLFAKKPGDKVSVLKMSLDSGKTSWAREFNERNVSGAATDEEALYFLSISGNVYAVRLSDGQAVEGFEIGIRTFAAAGVATSTQGVFTGGNPKMFAFKPID